ncbi:response regulator [Flavobacterium amniphilum]|uniref:response regulator n=1 Tax=Flavobacterium amniphilum TaxID=1834035 RepID=UPI00202A8642|nr:response regulator [Flavobacterium amniphilum]MCL9804490.1 response regulator [Flavobacterium amniphilum]
MFTKVLVVDDIDLNNIATEKALTELGINDVTYAKYCDEALLKIKKAELDRKPFELLVSDLSFKADHRDTVLKSGEELIAEVKKVYPHIKVIAFSIDERSYTIKKLLDETEVEAYVLKSRNSSSELKKAIQLVYSGEDRYLSPDLQFVYQDKTTSEIDNFDIQLLKQLSLGVPQDAMEYKFKELGITPNSKSTIEKRIAKLKDYFKANNPTHLVAIAKDLGLV